MPRPESKRINRDQYDAVLFDLDGVITNTATLHATCWKQMFDEYLRKRAEQKGEAFRPFDLATDYQLYVDGKPRFDGVRDFLRSRGIQLPEGNPDDPADVETVHGLGHRKDDLVNHAIAEVGVESYAGTVQFIHQRRRNGFKIAVVTSSQHCDAVLRAAKLDDLFEVRVDGNLIQAQRVAGKPAPDTFLMAARLLALSRNGRLSSRMRFPGLRPAPMGTSGL
jgi:beta-phosphoglucomutase-like phosphatase (HAD superfamily)